MHVWWDATRLTFWEVDLADELLPKLGELIDFLDVRDGLGGLGELLIINDLLGRV